MNTHILKLALVSLFLVTTASASAQDSRVRSALDNAGLKYTITDNGNFKIPFDMGNGRTQVVIVNSKTYEFGGAEIREIFSVAAIVSSKSAFTHNNLFKLLELNETYKIGAWQIHGGESPYILQFAIRAGANTSSSILADLIKLAAKTADDMEQRLTDEDKH
jgi:hypothetical protein